MCVPFETVQPPTPATQKAVSLLKYLAIAELIVVMIKLIVLEDFMAFFELFLIFILYAAWAQLNYCSCVFFVLYCLYQMLIIFVIFGTRVQDGQTFFGEGGQRIQAQLVILFILFFYYGGAAYVAFLSYKQGWNSRSIKWDSNSEIAINIKVITIRINMNQLMEVHLKPNIMQKAQQDQPTQQSGQFQAFQGRGVTVG